MRTLALVWLALTLALGTPALSQTEGGALDLDGFNSLAATVESELENNPDIDALEQLRTDLADRRTEFLDAQSTNAGRIATVRGQIAALGPAPAEGEDPEAEDIAARRDDLNAQLAELRAPAIAAEEAYSQADGLIARIDAEIRDQYATQLLAREPSPLNPAYWVGATDLLADFADMTVGSVSDRWSDPDAHEQALETLPITIPFLAIAALLIFRSRWWIGLLMGWAAARSPRGQGVVFFLLSLGQVVLPIAGVFLVANAARLSGLAGNELQGLLDRLPFVMAPIFVAKWLTSQLLSTRPDTTSILDSLGPRKDRMRRVGTILGYTVAVLLAIDAGAEALDRSDVAVDVVRFVPRAILAYFLFRIGQMLLRAAGDSSATDSRLSSTVQRFLGRLSYVAGGVGLLLAAAGYTNAAKALLIPMVLTLALTAVIALLQKLTEDVYALLTGTREGESEALAPLLIGIALVCLALPLYALVWGARVADLTEVWSRFSAGFAVGDTRISPADFLTFLLIFAIGYGLTRFLQGMLRNTVLPKTRMDVGGRNAVVSGVGYIGIFIAALVAITSMGIDLTSLAVVAGALSVGIGFGLQNVVSNFVSGIILLIERPISEGDWIEVGGQMGYVRDISVRSTRIETFDRTDVIVPNADLVSGTVTNWTRGNNTGRVIVPVGVAYGTDTEWVSKVLREVAEAHPMVVLSPPPAVLFRAFGASSMDFEIRAILRDVNFVIQVQSDLLHGIAKRFKEEGIEIPYPQQDLWLRNPETLRQAT